MKNAILLSLTLVILMTLVIVWGFTTGDFLSEGSWIVNNPWGIVSLVDIYSSMALFAAWIIFREKSLLRSVPWILILIMLGSLGAAIYVLQSLIKSKGNWIKFFLGERES